MEPQEVHDFNEKMAARIEAAIPIKGIHTARQVAESLHGELEDEDPALLYGWLRANAVQFLSGIIGERLRSERGRYRNASRKRFGENLSEYMEQRFVISNTHEWKRLADMTGADHRYVATQYEVSAKTDILLGKFHTAVAKKVGVKRTEEVFDAETLLRLEQSILGII